MARRYTDRELADIICASAGYRLFAGATDKAKVAAARDQGIRKPTPSNREAIAAQDLYLSETPTPPPPSAIAPVFQGDAVYVNAVSSFDGTRRNPAYQAGYRTAYVQLLHVSDPDRLQSNKDHLSVLRGEGWKVGGWGTYGQSADPAEDARAAAQLVLDLGLVCWKANGEAWAEATLAWKTQAFIQAWNEAGAPCPLGWSVLSSDTDQFARAFDYTAALAVPGADIDIQVYGATYPTYTVGAGLGMLARTPVPVNRTTMTFDVTETGVGPFPDYRTWQGARRLWVGEWSTADTYRQLAR